MWQPSKASHHMTRLRKHTCHLLHLEKAPPEVMGGVRDATHTNGETGPEPKGSLL